VRNLICWSGFTRHFERVEWIVRWFEWTNGLIVSGCVDRRAYSVRRSETDCLRALAIRRVFYRRYSDFVSRVRKCFMEVGNTIVEGRGCASIEIRLGEY